jgi:hypothetical protein
VNADLLQYDVCEESMKVFKEDMRAARTGAFKTEVL